MKRVNNAPDRTKAITYAAAFLLPCLLMGVVFAVTGIYPFGDKSLLIIDMSNEYVDYLAQMNQAVRSGGSLLRSWNMGMGLGMLGLIAFYTSSPFNLLVLLFPVSQITEVIFVITLLKLGLAGLLFAVYTNYAMDRRGLFNLVFAVAYALCGYNIAYASNIMWLDGAAFLPLVLLGAERVLRENKCRTLLLSLVYVFFTSYYIGYMIGVFSFLYFTAVWFSRSSDWKAYLRKLLRFLGCAAGAAGCCAFLLLPAFLGLQSGQSAMWDIGVDWSFRKPLVRIASRLLPGVYDTLTDPGYPNIFCTILAVLLCICFFTCKAASRREKIVFGGLLASLFVSFSWVFLDLAWHAFEDPTWFPARYSFVFCFLVLYLAMRAAKDGAGLSQAGVWGALAFAAALLVEVGIGRYRYQSLWNVAAAAVLFALYAGLWLLWSRRRFRWAPWAALLLVCLETAGNAYIIELGLDTQFAYKTRDSYTAFREAYGPAVEAVEALDGGVYRLEIMEQRGANGGMALGYNGISHYSTTTDQNLNAFLRRLGYNKGTENELRFAVSTPLTNGMLGIRYVLSKEDPGSGYTLLEMIGDVGIYRNELAFPLAYWTAATELDFSENMDPFGLQNDLLDRLFDGGQAYTPIANVQEERYNVTMAMEQGHFSYTPRAPAEPAAVAFAVANPAGQPAYAYFPVWQNRFTPGRVLVDGAFVQDDLRYRKNAIVPLGDGREIDLRLELGSGVTRIRDRYFYSLDLAAASDAAAQAGRYALEFDIFQDTSVRGRVFAPQDGTIVTTFPLDSGWTVRVDGKKTGTGSFAGVFLAVPVAAGEHVLEFRYSPPGFAAGCWIAILSVTSLIILQISNKSTRSDDPNNKNHKS